MSEKTSRIRWLNDQFRTTLSGGKQMLTSGVSGLPEATKTAVLEAVQAFESFTADNDPHGEHDFGSVEVEGQKLFWKIDLYEEAVVKRHPLAEIHPASDGLCSS